jgi:UDP-glucose 4-epimerase
VCDRATVRDTLSRHQVTSVVHLASRKSPAESVRRPDWYHAENVGGLGALLAAMADGGACRLLFSSSAAVYGVPATPVVDETAPTAPINPYGQTKLVGERLIAAAGRDYGLSWTALRYFNVVGAAEPALADWEPTNLVPIAFTAMSAGHTLTVTGADYPTPDGTGVRDYIDVRDLAAAHVVSALRLESGPQTGTVYNVGTGRGYSVLEVVERIRSVTGQPLEYLIGPRRPGDPPAVVADAGLIRRELGWQARYDLTDMIESTWRAWSAVPVR